jgi:DNA (cytosine-5)-methyltransferase 1
MSCRWQCEINEFCRSVLARHWPDVPRVPDVREVNADTVPRVDVLAGGFPCPSESQAARGRNNATWMWPYYADVVRSLRPRYVLVENVQGLLYAGRGFGEILGDLAELGFDAAWRVLRASDFDAPHQRARVWLVGYAHRDDEPDLSLDDEVAGVPELRRPGGTWPDPPRGLGVADGVPERVVRLKALGNALVPDVAEWIGRRVVDHAGRVRHGS